MSDRKLRLVHDSELKGLLQRLEMLDDFEAGSIHCIFCDDVIGEHNLHAIMPLSNLIRFSCAKPECIEALAAKTFEGGRQ